MIHGLPLSDVQTTAGCWRDVGDPPPSAALKVAIDAATATAMKPTILLGAGVDVVPREREWIGARIGALRGERLLDRDPAPVEGVRAAGEVGAPDAQALLIGVLARFGEVGLEAARPVPEGLGIVKAQRLDVHHLEPALGHFPQHQRDVRQLAVREDVLADELAGAQADGAALGIDRGDAMVHDDAAVLQQPPDGAEIQRQVLQADVLEHAHRSDLVVHRFARNVAVVLQQHFAAPGEAVRLDAFVREAMLILGERHSGCLDAVVLGGPAHQRAPAAADVEELVARLQAQLAAEVVELLRLREVDVLVAGLEVGARVHHLAVEEQRVELVRDVVVVVDGLRVAAARVQVDDERAAAFLLAAEVARQALGGAQHVLDRPFDVDVALDVRLAELGEVRVDEVLERAGARDPDGDRGLRGQRVALAVPQLDGERQVGAPLQLVDGFFNPRFEQHQCAFSRRVTNSSATVGWMPRVASKSALVAPSFTAIATPWMTSPASGPIMCAPTTRCEARSTISFMKVRSLFAVSVSLRARNEVLYTSIAP